MSTASTVPANDAAETRLYDCRDAYAKALEEMAEADPRVCAVVSDSVSSTKLKSFSQKFPARFVNVGIAEQNIVGVGAGREWWYGAQPFAPLHASLRRARWSRSK